MVFVSWTPAGRLGNFFMTAMSVFAYAKRHGLNFTVPFNTSSDYWSPIYLKHLQDKRFDDTQPTIRIKEKQFHYVPLEFHEDYKRRNVIIQGYLQSHLYHKEFREEIIEAFALPYELKEDTCSIHARYGDYLTIEGKHIIVDEPYLQKSMGYIMNKTGIKKFKVFSDNLDLFRERHGALYDFEYSPNQTEMDDLIEMSSCAHNINSSSTFSWTSAWLNRNPNKIVITQREWFQTGWDLANTKDVIPSSWLKM